MPVAGAICVMWRQCGGGEGGARALEAEGGGVVCCLKRAAEIAVLKLHKGTLMNGRGAALQGYLL